MSGNRITISFPVATASADEAFVIAVSGQADLHTAPELREAIGSAIDEGHRQLAIDLTEATFIDSMTLGCPARCAAPARRPSTVGS